MATKINKNKYEIKAFERMTRQLEGSKFELVEVYYSNINRGYRPRVRCKQCGEIFVKDNVRQLIKRGDNCPGCNTREKLMKYTDLVKAYYGNEDLLVVERYYIDKNVMMSIYNTKTKETMERPMSIFYQKSKNLMALLNR